MRTSSWKRPAWALITLLLVSCNDANRSVAPNAGAPNAGAPMVPQMSVRAVRRNIVALQGSVNGADDRYSPPDGDMKTGGRGQTVDGIACTPSMISNMYHVHAFLGVIVNEREIAMPDGMGMVDPARDVRGFVNSASCFYAIHTHDASGIVHIEADQKLHERAVLYHLQQVLDIWGIARSATQFGPFSGPVHVFVGNVPALRQTTVTSYTEYTKPMDDIPLRSHEAIWVEVGSRYYTASELPTVRFYTEY